MYSVKATKKLHTEIHTAFFCSSFQFKYFQARMMRRIFLEFYIITRGYPINKMI